MSRPRQSHAVHHHYVRYPVTVAERFWALIVGPLFVCVLIYAVILLFPAAPRGEAVTLTTIFAATLATLVRIAVAYAFAILFAVPLALLVEWNATVESFLLPIFDVFESIPNLAILPVILVFFLQIHFLEGAALTILFLNMVWNIVFALVGGLKVIPRDVKDAAHVFGLRGFSYLRRLILPAIFPQFITGSILAVASGWNIIIVAEALHAYLPAGAAPQDLFGVGSVLVSASANGQSQTYITAFVVMVVVIALFNFFVWQKLLNYSQRFRFE
jgi:NitT/TauT family transport system permease protein